MLSCLQDECKSFKVDNINHYNWYLWYKWTTEHVYMCECACMSVYVYLGLCLYVYECIDMYIVCTYVCLLRACIHVNMNISGFVGQRKQVKFTNTGNPRGCPLLFEMDSEDRPEGRYQGTLPVHTYCGHKWASIWSIQLANPTWVPILSSLLVPTGGKAKATSVFFPPHTCHEVSTGKVPSCTLEGLLFICKESHSCLVKPRIKCPKQISMFTGLFQTALLSH